MTSADHAISNIAFQRLKVSRFKSLNDPFELLALNVIDRALRKRLMQNREEIDKRSGLLCFTGDWKDPVHWAHYGDRNSGICLGFDVEEGWAKNVDYKPKRLTIEMDIANELTEEIQKHLLLTKFESWRYEDEWRALVELDAQTTQSRGTLHFQSLGKKIKLVEVVLGSLCAHKVSEVRNLVERIYPDDDTITFGARLASKSFNIVPDENTLPDWHPKKKSLISRFKTRMKIRSTP